MLTHTLLSRRSQDFKPCILLQDTSVKRIIKMIPCFFVIGALLLSVDSAAAGCNSPDLTTGAATLVQTYGAGLSDDNGATAFTAVPEPS